MTTLPLCSIVPARSLHHRAFTAERSSRSLRSVTAPRRARLQPVSMARTESQQSQLGSAAPDFNVSCMINVL